jgi:hypothetical protein
VRQELDGLEEAQGGPLATSHLLVLHENWKEVMQSELSAAEYDAHHAYTQLTRTNERLASREDDLALMLHR